MTNEEFEHIKEEEKAHLREIRKLRNMAKHLRARRSVQAALERMLDGSREVLDTHDEMVRRLAVETARHEARLDLALESPASSPEDVAAGDDPMESLDDALLKARARQLLDRMTAAAADDGDAAAAESPEASGSGSALDRPTADPADPADQRPADEQDAPPPPRKTLGRPR
ncbi:MAG: hypothetical protein GVY12_12120 [Bacteroidetes bacterium]|jgi:hypothetical protein|nr:hypothetical protein [Bacteroidota bacterium]